MSDPMTDPHEADFCAENRVLRAALLTIKNMDDYEVRTQARSAAKAALRCEVSGYVCDVAGCEHGFPTMAEVVAHEHLHDAWRTR